MPSHRYSSTSDKWKSFNGASTKPESGKLRLNRSTVAIPTNPFPPTRAQDPLALFFLKADKVKPSPRVPYLWREVWLTPLVLGRPLEPLTPRQAKGRLTPTESRRDLRESKVRPPKRNLGPKSANESLREIARRDPREIRPTALPPRRHVAPPDDATAPIPTATALPSPSSPFLLDPSVAGRPNTLHEHTLGM